MKHLKHTTQILLKAPPKTSNAQHQLLYWQCPLYDRCHTCDKVARLWCATRGGASKSQVWQGVSHVASWRVAQSRDSFSE